MLRINLLTIIWPCGIFLLTIQKNIAQYPWHLLSLYYGIDGFRVGKKLELCIFGKRFTKRFTKHFYKNLGVPYAKR